MELALQLSSGKGGMAGSHREGDGKALKVERPCTELCFQYYLFPEFLRIQQYIHNSDFSVWEVHSHLEDFERLQYSDKFHFFQISRATQTCAALHTASALPPPAHPRPLANPKRRPGGLPTWCLVRSEQVPPKCLNLLLETIQIVAWPLYFRTSWAQNKVMCPGGG